MRPKDICEFLKTHQDYWDLIDNSFEMACEPINGHYYRWDFRGQRRMIRLTREGNSTLFDAIYFPVGADQDRCDEYPVFSLDLNDTEDRACKLVAKNLREYLQNMIDNPLELLNVNH